MSKLEQLLEQRAAMDQAIAAEKNKGRDDALASVRSLCKQYGITMNEVKAYLAVSESENSQSKITSDDDIDRYIAPPKQRLLNNEKISFDIIFTTSLILNFVASLLTDKIPSNSEQWTYFVGFTIGIAVVVYIVHYFYWIYGAIITFVWFSIYLLYEK